MSSNSSESQSILSNRPIQFFPYLAEVGLIVLLLVATVVINLRMIRDGLNGYGDLLWHITWIQHFSKQIFEGIWYPRWLAGTNFGYGSPTFVFYPPLVYYIGSFFKLIGLNIEQTMTALFSSGLFGAGLSFYIYGRNKWGRIPAFIGGLSYMTIPAIADLINGGGLASLFAMALIPLGMYLTDQALVRPKWRAALAIFWSTIALTHVPSLLFCTIAWLFYTLFFLLKRPWKAVITTIASAGIGFGMVSFYLLPAILEQRFVNIEYMRGIDGGRFQASIFKFLDGGLSNIFIQELLAMVVLTIVSTLICLKGFRKNAAIIKETWLWLAFLIILVFLMSEWSWPIWKSSNILQMLQTPRRLGALFFFGEATLCGLTLSQKFQLRQRLKIFPLIIITIVIIANFKFGYQLFRALPALHNPGRGKVENLERLKIALYEPYTNKLIDVPEYRPSIKNSNKLPLVPRIDQPPVSVMSGKAAIQLNQWDSYNRMFNVTAEDTSSVRIRTYYYPAWHLYINQKPYPIDVSDDGTMKFTVEPGFYAVALRYQWTQYFTLGIILSIFSSVALVLFWIKSPKNSGSGQQ
ncbi:hypothetical protein H6F78_00885 [Coleofasciculus sp. FACHB-64]|uniref:6-pyruvoyl-tetrahydropterin synthase-related protein n=1 Tax=Cyanophyceae TaxID=3028117 RepID=UPI00168821C9|nr:MULTISPECIES: 6-pyruvoyl-tetrahydropterin synthase-related protein [unclassified Coleofasciculus]MBD1839774.1 hypothetical protein [Coleofasciculus sp. FACHB-501]MBD2044197.1 hypothetical protein [Coleofasciculus sp. FACHB-64]